MEWLYALLIAIQLTPVATIVWVWLHPKAEVLIPGTGRVRDHRFPAALTIGSGGLRRSGSLSGGLEDRATDIGAAALILALIQMLAGIRHSRGSGTGRDAELSGDAG